MTLGDAHRVGVAWPRKPANLPRPFLTRFFLISIVFIYLWVRAMAAAFRARHIGLVCVAPLSAIHRRRKADACAYDRASAWQVANAHGNNKTG
jgi:hypothetical protein